MKGCCCILSNAFAAFTEFSLATLFISVSSGVTSTLSDFSYLWSLFFFVSLEKVLSILLIFAKKQLLISSNLITVISFSVLFFFTLVFPFLLLALKCFKFALLFSSSSRCKVRF